MSDTIAAENESVAALIDTLTARAIIADLQGNFAARDAYTYRVNLLQKFTFLAAEETAKGAGE